MHVCMTNSRLGGNAAALFSLTRSLYKYSSEQGDKSHPTMAHWTCPVVFDGKLGLSNL